MNRDLIAHQASQSQFVESGRLKHHIMATPDAKSQKSQGLHYDLMSQQNLYKGQFSKVADRIMEVEDETVITNRPLRDVNRDTYYKDMANIKPFKNIKSDYPDYRNRVSDQQTLYSLDMDRHKPKTQMFSYFYHDMEKEEREYILPKKQEYLTCKDHKEPVVMYSYPYNLFVCQRCYEKLYDKKECYGLSDLQRPMEMLYDSLMQYIEYGREPKLQKQLMEHKAYLEQVKEDRYKYLTEYERAQVDKEITEVLFDLQKFWRKIEEMQIEYRNLRKVNDFETIICMFDRWSSICYDFKDKYLSFDYLRNLIDRRIDPIMRPIALKVGLCYMCMQNQASMTCNNIKDTECKICKECANFCTKHGYYCRLHEIYYGHKTADKSYMGNSCDMCKYENIQL